MENGIKVKSLSCIQLFVTPWTVAHQTSLSMGFSRKEYWSGLPFPSPGDLPDSEIKPRSPSLWTDTLPSESPGKPQKMVSRFFKKLRIELPYDPATPLLGIYPDKMYHLKRYMHPNVHSCTIYNSQSIEASKVHQQMNGQRTCSIYLQLNTNQSLKKDKTMPFGPRVYHTK